MSRAVIAEARHPGGNGGVLFSSRIRYGGDYNPEQWSRNIWVEDIKLMAEAGVNLVTVGVFSWSMLEPSEGQFCFEWLRDVLDLLHASKIGVDLATPTASPPPWVSVDYPESLPVDERGVRYRHGSRQHLCVLSPDYRRLAHRIVEQLASEVGDHEAIELFHVHNEYANHVPFCYCPQHEAAFRAWLARRYGSLQEVNEAWGTTFWSQRYSSFEQIIPPQHTPTWVNPGQQLDFRRFSSDAFFNAFQDEVGVLRRTRPDVPVTTNLMGLFEPLDYFEWAPWLDVLSTDNYPNPADPDAPVNSAMHCDLVRSLNKSLPWMVMEQSPGRVNWQMRNVAKRPGEMRAYSYQAIARGARGLLFFQWRASRSGAEKFASGMVGHSGTKSPVWSEIVALGHELGGLDAIGEAVVMADVAICFSWPSWWAMEAPCQPLNELSLRNQLLWVYTPLYRRGVTVDFCRPDEPLGNYRAVLVPSLYLISPAEAANLVGYVFGGGTAVVTFWSGIVDPIDRVYLGTYGGPLRGLFGGEVVDVTPLPDTEQVDLEWCDGTTTKASTWIDLIDEEDGEVLARVSSGPWAGRPAVLRARRGAGCVFYLGTRLDSAGLARVFDAIFDIAPAISPEQASDKPGLVERVVRRDREFDFEFLINHGPRVETVTLLEPDGTELLTRAHVERSFVLAPQGVAIVRRPRS